MLLRIGLILFAIGSMHSVFAQVVYYVNLHRELRYLELSTCKDTLIVKTINPLNPNDVPSDVAIAPDGSFYVCFAFNDLYKVNTQTGQMTFITHFDKTVSGLVCDINGIIWAGGFALYSYNTSTGEKIDYGDFNLFASETVGGDLTFRNGKLYMIDALSRVREVNLTPPLAGKIIQDLTGKTDLLQLWGLFSIYYSCDSVVTYTSGTKPAVNLPKMAEINFETGTVTQLNCIFPQGAQIYGATSPLEFLGSVPCLHEFDLDADNSSGAAGKDYTASDTIFCKSNGVFIADTDFELQYYKHLDSVQIHFLPGSPVPDGPDEQIVVFTTTGLNFPGNSTGRVTLSGKPSAPDSVFRKSLASTIYANTAPVRTTGTRTIRIILWAGGKAIDTALVSIHNPPPSVSSVALQTCPGTTVAYGGEQLAAGETRNFVFKNVLGCDSIVTVTVSAMPISIINLEVKACPETTYEYEGVQLAVGETRSFFLKNWQNCDSIVNVKVTALPVSAASVALKACPGSTVSYAGTDLVAGETRDFILKNWLGCDSVVTVTVSALPISVLNLEVNTCPGTTYTYQGIALNIGETRSFFLKNWQNCDSIVNVKVTALPVSAASVALKACPGSTVSYAGTDLVAGETRDFILKNWLGCDSVVTVTVSALPISVLNLEVNTCPGTTYTYQGIALNIGETRSFFLKNWQNCDSIINVKVSALPVSASALHVKTCLGTTYLYGAAHLSVGAIQNFTFQNWLGCDSVVTVTVSALPTSTGSVAGKACPGGTFEYAGEQLAVGTVKDFTLKNWLGCDSILTVTVSDQPVVAFSLLTKASCPNAPTGELTVSPLGGSTEISTSLNATDFQNTLTFQQLSEGAYTLTVKDQNGCTAQQEVVLGVLPTAAFTLPDAFLPCDAPSVTLSPAWDNKPAGLQYKWYNGATDETIQVMGAGSIWLEVSDQCQTVRQEAHVRWEGEHEGELVYVPNTFSPDAQELVNSVFKPFIAGNVEVARFRLQIFDRWGNLIFSTDQLERGWDGYWRHDAGPGAVFVWTLEAELIFCGQITTVRKSGDVTLVRK